MGLRSTLTLLGNMSYIEIIKGLITRNYYKIISCAMLESANRPRKCLASSQMHNMSNSKILNMSDLN